MTETETVEVGEVSAPGRRVPAALGGVSFFMNGCSFNGHGAIEVTGSECVVECMMHPTSACRCDTDVDGQYRYVSGRNFPRPCSP